MVILFVPSYNVTVIIVPVHFQKKIYFNQVYKTSFSKKSGNGFIQFCRQKQRDTPGWSALSTPELVELCNPLWSSKQGVRGGFDSYGRPLVQLVIQARQEGLEVENMKTDIKSRVDRALMNHQLEDETFYLLHTNVFCLTAEGGVVPAELSLARVSLRQGVEEMYQEFIEPGTLPKGYRADCTENSTATHA